MHVPALADDFLLSAALCRLRRENNKGRSGGKFVFGSKKFPAHNCDGAFQQHSVCMYLIGKLFYRYCDACLHDRRLWNYRLAQYHAAGKMQGEAMKFRCAQPSLLMEDLRKGKEKHHVT